MNINEMQLRIPSDSLVNEYVAKFNQDQKSISNDNALALICRTFPENKDIEHVILKVNAINSIYSTGIYNTYKVARRIQSISTDERLMAFDITLVSDIAKGHGVQKKSGGDRNFYSFASKFCSFHNKEVYPIYDSRVHEQLVAHQVIFDFAKFQESDLKEYTSFKSILMSFRNFFQLSSSLKDIDKYLWYYYDDFTKEEWKSFLKKDKKKGKSQFNSKV